MKIYLMAALFAPFAALAAEVSAPAALPSTTGAAPRNANDEYWHNIDTNGDGAISEEEFMAASKKRFQEMDADHDGKVTREEWKAYNQRRMQPALQPMETKKP